MATVSFENAQTQLADLLVRAEGGEEIIITRAERPAVRLTVVLQNKIDPSKREAKPDRRPGRLKGQFSVPDSFFDPLSEEELLLWEGGSDETTDSRT